MHGGVPTVGNVAGHERLGLIVADFGWLWSRLVASGSGDPVPARCPTGVPGPESGLFVAAWPLPVRFPGCIVPMWAAWGGQWTHVDHGGQVRRGRIASAGRDGVGGGRCAWVAIAIGGGCFGGGGGIVAGLGHRRRRQDLKSCGTVSAVRLQWTIVVGGCGCGAVSVCLRTWCPGSPGSVAARLGWVPRAMVRALALILMQDGCGWFWYWI